MSDLLKRLREAQFEPLRWDGKYLRWGNELTSIPGRPGDDYLMFRGSIGDVRVHKRRDGMIEVDIDNDWEKEFKDVPEFVTWANEEELRFIGVDDL